jgi:uncharacterized protein YceH (UPF0502 family)
MQTVVTRLACTVLLSGALGACTLFGIDTDSTTTEYRQDTGLEQRVDQMEQRLQHLERRMDDHTARAGS